MYGRTCVSAPDRRIDNLGEHIAPPLQERPAGSHCRAGADVHAHRDAAGAAEAEEVPRHLLGVKHRIKQDVRAQLDRGKARTRACKAGLREKQRGG